MIILIIILLIVVISTIFSAMVTLHGSWKYYKTFYKSIPTLVSNWPGELTDPNNRKITIFNDNDVCFAESHYLFISAFFTYLDPYSCYWAIKINKALNKKRKEFATKNIIL